MKPLPHEYQVRLEGASKGYATLSASGLPELTAAPPPQYDGPGDAWSPEHLLLASVSACFLFTFRAVAKASRLDFVAVDVCATGTVARESSVSRFTDIVLHADVTAAAGDVDGIRRAVEKAHHQCLISSSLATPVRVHATVQEMCEQCLASTADLAVRSSIGA